MRALTLMTTSILVACGGLGPDERTGGDGGRGDAQPAAVDQLLYDRLSTEQGDSTDWKKFVIEETAKVSIKVWWDDPKAVAATVEVRDKAGEKIGDLKHDKNSQSEVLGPLKLKGGTYFLRFKADGGSSVYSYEISTGSGGGDAAPDI